MGSKRVPNRIINAEGVRKALDRHLGGYHSALGAILGALGRILSAIRWPEAAGPANSGAKTASGEGGERKPLRVRTSYWLYLKLTAGADGFNRCARTAGPWQKRIF